MITLPICCLGETALSLSSRCIHQSFSLVPARHLSPSQPCNKQTLYTTHMSPINTSHCLLSTMFNSCTLLQLVNPCCASSSHPLSSARQHPSNGDCLEVKRQYYQNCSVLIVWHTVRSLQHTYMSSSYRSNSPTRHIIGHFGDDFYRSDDQTNSVKALKETSWSSKIRLESQQNHSTMLQLYNSRQLPLCTA